MRVKLKDVCEKATSNLKQSDILSIGGKYPVYGASGYLGNIDSYHQDKPYIAVVKDGAGIGRTTILPPKSSVIGTMQYLIPKENVMPEYLYYVVKHMRLQKYYTGATIPHIYFKDYQNEVFNLADSIRQREIVKVLKNVEDTIRYQEIEINKFDELIKARFIEMFGDPKYNKSNLIKIKEIGSLTSGGTPSRAIPEYFKGNIRWYSAGELNSLYLTDSIEHISETALHESSAKLFNKGTLMIGMYDTAAFKLGILTEDSSSNQACANLKPKSCYNIVWLYYLFDIMKPIFLQERQGVRQKNLSLSKIKEFEIPNAPVELQNKFEFFVQQVDKSRFDIKKSIIELEREVVYD